MKNITFINAGAGSGKTYSLTEELYQYISSGQCRGNEVLLTTFTVKAAEEIKQRAYERLFAEGKIEDAILLQEAFSGTIHAIGNRFIHKFCYLAGLSPDIKELTEEDSDFYFTQAISSLPTPKELDRLDQLFNLFDFQKLNNNISIPDPERWKTHVKEIIKEARRNRIRDLSETSLSYNKSIENLKQIFAFSEDISLDAQHLKNQADQLFLLLESLPDKGNNERKKNAKRLKNEIKAGGLNYSRMISLYDIASDVLEKVDEHYQPGVDLREATFNFIHSQQFIHDLIEYTSLIFKIASSGLEEFEKYKNEHALIDYTDMEARFLDLLDMPEVQDEIRAKIRIVLVDEFQDSNPVQLDIIRKLSEIIGKAIWVGDPKQSIFGFNGADPSLVNKILDLFYQENHQGLSVKLLKNSWRSRKDLVGNVNRIFEEALLEQSYPITVNKNDILGKPATLKDWLYEKFGSEERIILSEKDTIGLIPVRSDENTDFAGSDKYFPFKDWHFTNPVSKGGSNKSIFHYYLARKIKHLLEEKIPVSDKMTGNIRTLIPSDIAVLCRNGKDVNALASELLQNGLEVAASVDGLTTTAEYRLVINILNYMADPSNSLSIAELKLLVSHDTSLNVEKMLDERIEFVRSAIDQHGMDTEEYYRKSSEWGKDHFLIKKLDAFHNTSKHLSVPELIEKLNAWLELPRYVSAWGNAGQRKSNLQQIIKYAYEYDNYCLRLNLASGIAGFVNWLSSRKEKDSQAASVNMNAVNVLTYHKAKGLEWPFVILYNLDNKWNDNILARDFFRTSVKSDGDFDFECPLKNRYINFSFWPFGKKEKIMGYEAAIMTLPHFLEREKEVKNEAKRLMYVGMTRARDYLVTTRLKDKAPEWLKMVTENTPGWLDAHCSRSEIIPDENAEFDQAYDENPYRPEPYFSKQEPLPQSNPRYISPSKVHDGEDATVYLVQDFEQPIRVGNHEDDAVFGNCLHSLLFMRLADDGFFHPEGTIERFNLAGMIDVIDLKKGFDLFVGYIKSLKPVKTYRELPLRMGRGDNIIIGTADLVLECDDGLYLFDYKSYPGGKSDVLDKNDKHFAGIYAGQLKTYAEMMESATGKKVLKKMIYYPIIGIIVELN